MNPSRPTLHVAAPDSAVRADQARFARGQGPEHQKKFVAKGHDAQLQDAQFNRREVVVELIGERPGEDGLVGIITRRDKWTITVLEHGTKHAILVYKHAIKTIVIKDPLPQGDN